MSSTQKIAAPKQTRYNQYMEAFSDKDIAKIKAWLGTGSINIFGMPFAGKDTHGRELVKLFDGILIGGGHIIRSGDKQHMKDHIAKGLLTPTDEYLALMLPYFSEPDFDGKPLILSSVGRWFGEEKEVYKATNDSGHPTKVVLYIDISADELHRRWQKSLKLDDRGRRHDDAEHILQTRIDEFNTKTLPVIAYYKDKGLLIHIDGNGTQAETLQKILQGLKYFVDEST